MTTDIINGLFETVSGLFQIINIVRIVKDKQVLGISILPTIFFILWGVFNVTYFYPGLSLPYSWLGGVVILLTNVIWILLVYRYRNYDPVNPQFRELQNQIEINLKRK